MINISDLKRIFNYDPQTGSLTWKVNTGKKRFIGSPAGTVRSDGYLRVGVNKKDYYVHRIIWAIAHEKWPKINIDHINGIPSDNRIANLREANQSQNTANSKSRRMRGVSSQLKKFRAQIMVNYRYIHLGTFNTEIEAKAAYEEAAKRFFGEYRRIA